MEIILNIYDLKQLKKKKKFHLQQYFVYLLKELTNQQKIWKNFQLNIINSDQKILLDIIKSLCILVFEHFNIILEIEEILCILKIFQNKSITKEFAVEFVELFQLKKNKIKCLMIEKIKFIIIKSKKYDNILKEVSNIYLILKKNTNGDKFLNYMLRDMNIWLNDELFFLNYLKSYNKIKELLAFNYNKVDENNFFLAIASKSCIPIYSFIINKHSCNSQDHKYMNFNFLTEINNHSLLENFKFFDLHILAMEQFNKCRYIYIKQSISMIYIFKKEYSKIETIDIKNIKYIKKSKKENLYIQFSFF